MKKITFAGNLIVDSVKKMEIYPSLGMLSKIESENFCVGGVCNVSIDLKILDPKLKIEVLGRIGKDDKGRFVVDKFKSLNIDTKKIIIDEKTLTSYTDVMTDKNGARTFFQYGGANDNFSPKDVDVENLDTDIFHLDYLLLLPLFDQEDDEYGTKAARLFGKLQEKGIKTSFDVVSDSGDRYQKIVIPSLKYTNYVTINEVEISKITNFKVRDDKGKIIIENIKRAIERLFEFGVKDVVTIHCPEVAVMKKKDCGFTVVPSFSIQKEMIVSSVGAGDAFLSGVLYGLINNLSDEETLKIAHACAANNLFAIDSISGAKPIEYIRQYVEEKS
ncbi:MAG TPA: carbohydrate kinase family protein [Erysipelotrichaceae bacterium]|nr:carbohydrate kinase family protein [Erysipelotrichaceae bacterium]